MLFSDSVLKLIKDEAFEIFKQLPLYKKFVFAEPKISLKQGRHGEIIVCEYANLKMEIKLNFEVSIEEINFESKNITAMVKTKKGNWYSNDSVLVEGKIKISNEKSSIVYEESFLDKTTMIFFTDKYSVLYKKEIPADMVSFMS